MQQILNNLKSLRTSSSNSMPIVEPVANAPRLQSLMELIVPAPSIESDSPLLETTSLNHPDFFFDMQPRNFGAEKVRNVLNEEEKLHKIYFSYQGRTSSVYSML
jgi:hypothetical protein